LQRPHHAEHSTEPLFSDVELDRLVDGLYVGTGRLLEESEFRALLVWATNARVAAMLLEGLLGGKFVVRWLADDWHFGLRELGAIS
jgi:hypothetical protein